MLQIDTRSDLPKDHGGKGGAGQVLRDEGGGGGDRGVYQFRRGDRW
jgi:hypothetical protein